MELASIFGRYMFGESLVDGAQFTGVIKCLYKLLAYASYIVR